METFLLTLLANLASAAIIAFVGFLSRNAIRRFLVGGDLSSEDEIPKVTISYEPSSDTAKDRFDGALTVVNTGKTSVSDIGIYVCAFEPAKHSFLKISRISRDSAYTWIKPNSGETLVIHTDYLPDLSFDEKLEYRLYLEMANGKGAIFRRTVYLRQDGASAQKIMRVKRKLPTNKTYRSSSAVEKAVSTYRIDMSVD